MKVLAGLAAMLAAAVMLTQMGSRFGLSKELTRYILYIALAIFVVGLITQLVRWIVARKRAADKNAAPPDPAIAALRARLDDTRRCFAELARHQKKTAPQRPALLSAPFQAPWFMVLGLPAHGKTSLLGPTGARRLVEVDRDGVRSAPPETPPEDRPRCFSAPGGAVWLEVPHALARGEAMRPTWLAELGLLKKRRQPLHGVVLVVSADELLADADPTARAKQVGEELAAGLADVISTLAVHVPVFLVVSRLDRLAGFQELLAGAPRRDQALGFELPDGRSDDLVLKELRGRFDALCDELDARSLRAVSRFKEPDPAVQPRLMTFVRQFSELEEPLAALAKPLLAARGGDPVRLRGVYFASALQAEDPPIAPVLENLVRGAGGGSYAAGDPAAPTATRYFLDELIDRVLPRGAALATRTTRARRRSGLVRGLLSGVGVALAAWLGFGGTRVAQSNRALAQDTADRSGALMGQLGGERRAPLAVEELAPLHALLLSWEDAEGADAADVRGWGLFPGEQVVAPLQGFFVRAVFAGVLRPLRARAETQLRDFQARYESPDAIPESAERVQARDTLRYYLLLTGPKAPSEHLPIAQEADLVAQETTTRWSSSARASVDPGEYAQMRQVADKFVGLAKDPEFALPRDEPLIAAVREVLLRDTSEDAEVDKVIEDVSARENMPKISLRALAGVPSLENDGSDVRGAFTAAGWVVVKAEFLRIDDGAEWILGLEEGRAAELRRKRGRNLRSLYFQKYTQEWQRFVRRMRIVNPLNLEQGKQIFSEMARGPKLPLTKVFQKLQENVLLTDDFDYGDGGGGFFGIVAPGKKPSTSSAMRAADVGKQFASILALTVPPVGKDAEVPLDGYHTHIREIRDAIGKALESKEEEKALIERLKVAIEDTRSLIGDGNLEDWAKDTEELLVTPLRELLKLLERGNDEGSKNDWCGRIVDPMYERFAGRYPFEAGSRDDVVIADFEEFFHPENGVIRKAREELLSGWVTKSGNYYEARQLGKSEGSKLDPAVVKFLNRAQDIGMVMFPNEELRVDFDVVLVCNPQVSRVELKVGGEARTFECDSKQLPRVRWPGKEQGASLSAWGRQGRKALDEPGEWGLFELFERHSKIPSFNGEEVLDFVFDLSSFNLGSLEVRLKPLRQRGGTAFFGLSNGSRTYLSLLRASDVLPPKRLFSNRGGC